jgi:hypothetical protein
MDAERAARQAISALERGEPDRVLSLPAVMAATFHGLFPGLTVDLLAMVNKLFLPRTPADGSETREGIATTRSQSTWFRTLTVMGQRSAERFNQVHDEQSMHRRSADQVSTR